MGRELKRGLRVLRDYALAVGYGCVVYVYLVLAALSPAYALQNPTVNYSRVVAQAELIAAKAFQRATIADAVAAAAIVPTPVGLGIKVLALGLTVGVPLGVALWDTYYSGAQLSAIKAAAAVPPSTTLAGGSNYPVDSLGGVGNSPFTFPITFQGGSDQFYCCGLNPPSTTDSLAVVTLPAGQTFTVPSGWALKCGWLGFQCSAGNATVRYYGIARAGINQWTSVAGGPATQEQVKSYVQGLAAGDPNSVESHTTNQGVGATAPAHEAGTSIVTIVQNIDNSTTVIPASQVAAGDVIVNVSVPAPQNTTITNNTTNTNTSTTTTTTVTNPDGSVTTTATDTQTSTSPCTTLAHATDTLGSILARHQAAWQGSGLLSTLTALKGLVWAGTPPLLTLTTHKFGNFTVDFNSPNWAFVFLAMKSIFLAAAGLVSVRIVFGRG